MNTTTPRRGSALIGIGLASALLLACAGGSAGTERAPAPSSTAPPRAAAPAAQPAGSPVAAAPPLRARIAYTSVTANQAPWWVALESGYFREQGLDVDLGHVDPGATLLAAMNSGEVEVAAAGVPSVVLGHLQGLETVTIGALSTIVDGSIFARPEIQRVEDLRGKVIGVTRLKAVSDVVARQGLRRVGLDPEVDVVMRGTGGYAESLAAMETGGVDAASLTVPVLFDARRRGYREVLNLVDLNIGFLSSGIGTTRRVVAERPELGERVLRALAQSIHRLQQDRELGIQIFGKYSRSEDREMLAATIDYVSPLYRKDLYPDPQGMQAVIDAEEHPGARTLRPEDVTDYRFADRLRSSGFLDQLPK